jgi:hypothetical protein
MRIDKSLHKTDGLGRIGLVQVYLGRLPVKGIRPHIIHLLSLGTIGEYLYKTLEKILGIGKIPQIISAIGKLVIDVLKMLAPFENPEKFLEQLLGMIIILLRIILVSHAELIIVVIAFQHFREV